MFRFKAERSAQRTRTTSPFGSQKTLLSSAIATALLLAVSSASADGHETVESLKAQIAGMEKKFAAVTKDRDGLYDQLLSTIEDVEGLEQKVADVSVGRAHILEKYNQLGETAAAREAELQADIETAYESNDFLAGRVEKLVASSKMASADAKAKQAQMTAASDADKENMAADADRMAQASLAQIKNALQQRDEALAQVEQANAATASAKKGNKLVRNRLVSSKEQVAQANAAAASAKKGNQLVRNRLVSSKENVLAAKVESASLQRKIDFLNIQLARAQGDALSAHKSLTMSQSESESMGNKLNFLNIQLAKAEGDLASMLQEKEEAAKNAGAGPEWASELGNTLQAQFGGISQVQVSELPGNRVAIRIGNKGLFGSGAAQLSDTGRELLSNIGASLLQQSDAKILVLGHTDNVPVGANSSYVDNTDLSNRRALSAMRHLGDAVGVPFDRLSSTGLADNYPIASNNSAEGRALNRRIELELSPIK